MPRSRHKSRTPPKPDKLKQAFQILTLKGMQRNDKASEELALTFAPTPEGITAFSQKMVEYIGANKIDVVRASTINAYLQTIIRTSESGLDAVKKLEEDSLRVAEKIRALKPDSRRT